MKVVQIKFQIFNTILILICAILNIGQVEIWLNLTLKKKWFKFQYLFWIKKIEWF